MDEYRSNSHESKEEKIYFDPIENKIKKMVMDKEKSKMEKQYKSNSHESKERTDESIPNKKIEKVVKGEVRSRKKNELQKFTDVFISEDVGNLKDYIFIEVLVPAIKKGIYDVVTNGIDMILYRGTGKRKNFSPSKISYKDYSDDRSRRNNYSGPSVTNYENIIIESRGEAEDVLYRMDELIDEFGLVSVADLYDLVGISGNYTDNRYGWTDILSAKAVPVRDGYILKLPRALAFK